jgi:hypothetical protein
MTLKMAKANIDQAIKVPEQDQVQQNNLLRNIFRKSNIGVAAAAVALSVSLAACGTSAPAQKTQRASGPSQPTATAPASGSYETADMSVSLIRVGKLSQGESMGIAGYTIAYNGESAGKASLSVTGNGSTIPLSLAANTAVKITDGTVTNVTSTDTSYINSLSVALLMVLPSGQAYINASYETPFTSVKTGESVSIGNVSVKLTTASALQVTYPGNPTQNVSISSFGTKTVYEKYNGINSEVSIDVTSLDHS